LAEPTPQGFTVAEQNGPEHAITRVASNVSVFIGRALKGPVSQPVTVSSFAEYSQAFGGLWQPSMLSYAIEQFFENGGRVAVVIRVVNDARPPTLSLLAGRGQLRLRAIWPGSREYFRASVDYDGIGTNEPDRFNLVLQRMRSAGSEQIEDQEILRRVSITSGESRFVADVLAESRLARLVGDVPEQRPDRTPPQASGAVVGYVFSNPDGDDGAPLTDYDIIGSSQAGTGLFALRGLPEFNLLCIPPLARDHDVGLATLLVAARICRERHAMLLIDPPADWRTSQDALHGMRAWPFRSEDAAMFFPRVAAYDRLRGRFEVFGSAAAAAGLISRWDESWPVWAAAEADDSALRPGLKLATNVADADRSRLSNAGLNVLSVSRVPPALAASPRTLAAGNAATTDHRYLSSRRLALFVLASIERGTRWMIFEQNSELLWSRARRQVAAFLEALYREGAFVGGNADESYFVICDHRVNSREHQATGRVNLLFGFAAARPGEFHAYLVTHSAGGSRVKPVSVNRLATAQALVADEVETSILRSITVGE
jgi:uncharacterized protein